MRCCFANNKNLLKIFPNENHTNQCLRPGVLVFSVFKSFSIHITLLPLITQSSAIIEKQKFRQPLFYIDDIHTCFRPPFRIWACNIFKRIIWFGFVTFNVSEVYIINTIRVLKQSKSKSTSDCPIMCQSDFDNFYSKVKKMGFYGMGQPVYFL